MWIVEVWDTWRGWRVGWRVKKRLKREPNARRWQQHYEAIGWVVQVRQENVTTPLPD